MRTFPPAYTAELSRPGCLPYWLLKIVTATATYYLSDNDRYIPTLSAQAYGVVKSFGAVREGISGALADFTVSEYAIELICKVPVGSNVATVAEFHNHPAPAGEFIATLASGTDYTISFRARSASSGTIVIGAAGGVDLTEMVHLTPYLQDYSWTFFSTSAQTVYLNFYAADVDIVELLIVSSPETMDALAVSGALDDVQADLYLGLEGLAVAPQLILPGYIRDFGEISDTILPLVIQDNTIRLERFYIGQQVTLADYPTADPADVGKIIPICFGTAPKQPALALSMGARTTLKTAIVTTGETALYLSDATGLANGAHILSDTEQMLVSAVDADVVTVSRAYNGTTATTHNQGTAVIKLMTLVFCVSWRPVSSITKVWLRRNGLDLNITAYCTRYTGLVGNQLVGYGSMAMITISIAQMAQILAMAALQVSVSDTIATAAQDQYMTVDLDNYSSTGTIDYLPSIINGNLQEGSKMWASSSITLRKAKLISSSGRPFYVRVCVHAGNAIGSDTTGFQLHIGGVYRGTVNAGGSTPATFRSAWYPINDWSDLNLSGTYVYAATGSSDTVWIWEVWLEISFNPSAASTATPGVAKTGTVTAAMSGSVVSDYFGSGQVLADVSADRGSPSGMADWILGQAGMPATELLGHLATSQFDGRIDEYRSALWWLNSIAWQAGALFVMRSGFPCLVSRQMSEAVKSITACRVAEDGRRMLTRSRTSAEDVIDKISILYARDWSKSRGADAYSGQTLFAGGGSRERPELFQFDFIRSADAAAVLRDVYLSQSEHRRRLVKVMNWIDQIDLEIGDCVGVIIAGNEVGRVIASEPTPGSFDAADGVSLLILI